jgi:shikimate 5-dehydrogenase
VSDESKSGWDRVFEQLENPWDWAAAAVGGAGGAVATILAHGLDLGHSIPAAALFTVGARRAAVATFRRPELRKKAVALRTTLQENGCLDLVAELDGELKKWNRKITKSDAFDFIMDAISMEDSQRKRAKRSPLLLPPAPSVSPAA